MTKGEHFPNPLFQIQMTFFPHGTKKVNVRTISWVLFSI